MNIWVLPSLVAVAIIAGLTFYVIVRPPPTPLGPSTTATLISVLLFAIGDTATYFSTDYDSRWLATSISYSGVMLVGPSCLLLAHRFTEASGHPTPWTHTKWIYLPMLVMAPLWLGMMTNPIHGQFITLNANTRNEHHWVWHLTTYSSYIWAAASFFIYANLCIKVKSISQRRRILIMILAPAVAVAGNLAYLTPAIAMPFDPTPAAFAGTGVLFFAGIYRVGLFSLNPVAMSAIINQQPNGVVITDLDGTLLHWNDAAEVALRSPLSVAIGNFDAWLSPRLAFNDSNRSLSASELKMIVENLEIDAPTPNFKHLHHEDCWIQVRVDYVLSRHNRKIARNYFIRDISKFVQEENERRRVERKMFQSQKLEGIGLLAGGIAHDFNNLLMAIRGNAELLSADTKLDNKARDRLQVIETVSDRAARLTKKLLMYSGDAIAIKTSCDLSQLVRESSELIRTALLPKQLALSLQLEDNCLIEGDESQLEQVLLNLAINAAEAYEGNTGTVTIRTRILNPTHEDPGRCLHSVQSLDTDFVVLEVIDNGCGMTKDTMDRIADPFYSSKSHGRGLGLSAAMGIVRSHSGAIFVESELGEGTRFCALFPKQYALETVSQTVEYA